MNSSLRAWRCIVESAMTLTEYRPPNAAWFAGSKVVDDDGQPLVVYHGSDKSFSRFMPGHSNGMTNPRQGFYFTDNVAAAREFGDTHGYYLAIKHPADFREGEGQPFVDRALEADPDLAARYKQVVEDRYGPGVSVSRLTHMGLLQTDQFLAALQTIGCDGMFFDDVFSGHYFYSYVAFQPQQIKRVTRTPIKGALLINNLNY